jgi:hypothetical protein
MEGKIGYVRGFWFSIYGNWRKVNMRKEFQVAIAGAGPSAIFAAPTLRIRPRLPPLQIAGDAHERLNVFVGKY